MRQPFDFTDRTVVVTGAASGIGRATAELLISHGADVHTLDIAKVDLDVAGDHRCDLGDPGSIDAAVEQLPASIDAVVNCAGLPNGGRFSAHEVMKVNWLGLRHVTEVVLARMPRGSAVVNVGSTAGRDWHVRAEPIAELLVRQGFDDSLDWIDDNAELVGDGYAFSKEVVHYYTTWRSVALNPSGIRMNAVAPGVTNTALVDDFRRGVGDDAIDRAVRIAGRMAEPHEMAPALLFLADPSASSYVNGTTLTVDGGSHAARLIAAN